MINQNETNQNNTGNDDEYQDAVKTVVDDRMRTDILGPHFCTVLENHTPASDAIVTLMAKKINADPAIKTAIKSVIDERNKETKMRWLDRVFGIIGTIILATVIWGVQKIISG